MVSEDGEDLCIAAERYLLVDPIDGTKNCLAGNGEFAVIITSVDQGFLVQGVVYSPALEDLF